jgi:hypothetical protein
MTALTPNEKLRMTALALCESLRHWHDGKLEYDSAEHEALENALKEKDRFDSAYHIPGLLLLIENQQEEIERLRKALTIYADDENWIQGAGVADWIHDDDPQRIAQKALEVR